MSSKCRSQGDDTLLADSLEFMDSMLSSLNAYVGGHDSYCDG